MRLDKNILKFVTVLLTLVVSYLPLLGQKRNLIFKPVNAVVGYSINESKVLIQSINFSTDYLFRDLSGIHLNLMFGNIYHTTQDFYMADLGVNYVVRKKVRALGVRAGSMAYKGLYDGIAVNPPTIKDASGINNLVQKSEFPIQSFAFYIGMSSSNYSLEDDNMFNKIYIDAIIVPVQNISTIPNYTNGVGEYQFDKNNPKNTLPGHFGVRIGYDATLLNHLGFGMRPELILYPGGLASVNISIFLSSSWTVGKPHKTEEEIEPPQPKSF